MKKLVCLFFAFGFCATAVNAQTKALKTDTIMTPSVQCDMCKTRIEQYLKRIDGVTSANVVVKRKYTIVKYLTDRTNNEVIKAAIANTGYDVATKGAEGQPEIEIAANPEYYKLLPKCCKKSEDGGGMPKH
jgi:periplasmic mercuric ion binding protein